MLDFSVGVLNVVVFMNFVDGEFFGAVVFGIEHDEILGGAFCASLLELSAVASFED
jgi:hypothetical protein